MLIAGRATCLDIGQQRIITFINHTLLFGLLYLGLNNLLAIFYALIILTHPKVDIGQQGPHCLLCNTTFSIRYLIRIRAQRILLQRIVLSLAQIGHQLVEHGVRMSSRNHEGLAIINCRLQYQRHIAERAHQIEIAQGTQCQHFCLHGQPL